MPRPGPAAWRDSICRTSVSIPRTLSGLPLFTKSDFPLNVERPSCPCGCRWHSATVPEQPAHIRAASRYVREVTVKRVGAPASAAAQGPVQVGVLAGVADDGAAVRQDDGRLHEVVAGEAELARGEADPAAEGQAGDADGRTHSRALRQPAPRSLVVDVDQPRARADRSAVAGVDGDAVQPGDVHDHAGRRRVAAVAVAAGARDDPDLVLPRPVDGPLNVPQGLAERDRTRLHGVEARVEEHASLVVAGVAADDYVSLQLP